MRSTLLVPSERPPTLRDLKAALLTHDTVQLVDPDDRDLFPSTGFMMAMGMPPFMSMPSPNPVRRIGKASGYDDDFAEVVEGARAAIEQGTDSIVRTYRPPAPELRIGMVDLGGFPLDPSLLLSLFRSAAADPLFQVAAVKNDKWLFELSDRVWAVAETRGNADGTINGVGPLPDVTFPIANESLREPLSNIARARFGQAIKMTAFCMTKGLVPQGMHEWHDAILRIFVQNSAKFIDQLAEVDPYWSLRNRALKLVHDEYLDYRRLDQLSVHEILTLRTTAWGRQAEARDALFDSVSQIAREAGAEIDFDKAVAEKIRDYRQTAAEVEDERVALSFKVHCELSRAFLGAAGGFTAAGYLTSLGTGIGAGAALIAAAYYAVRQYQELAPISDQLRQAEAKFEADARYGIQNFYDRMP